MVVLAIGATRAPAQEPPPEPPAPVRIEAIPNGYQIFLDRPSAEFLLSVAEKADEKKLSEAIRDEAKKRKETDPDTATKLELVAFVVASQLPKFRKDLREQMGPGGVVIRVTGLQKPMVKFKRPALERAAGVVRQVTPLLPPDAQATIEAMRAIARTTPLTWKVEPLP